MTNKSQVTRLPNLLSMANIFVQIIKKIHSQTEIWQIQSGNVTD